MLLIIWDCALASEVPWRKGSGQERPDRCLKSDLSRFIDTDHGAVWIGELREHLAAGTTRRTTVAGCHRYRRDRARSGCDCREDGGAFGAVTEPVAGVLDIAAHEHARIGRNRRPDKVV